MVLPWQLARLFACWLAHMTNFESWVSVTLLLSHFLPVAVASSWVHTFVACMKCVCHTTVVVTLTAQAWAWRVT